MTDAETWFRKGNAHVKLGRFTEAINAYDRSLEINPKHLDSWYVKGSILVMIGKYPEAINAFDEYLKIKPENHTIWSNKGVALFQLGKYAEAVTACEKALEIDPSLKQFESEILSYLSVDFPDYYDKSVLTHKKESIKYISSLFDDFKHIHEEREKV